jgi:hypothetical protein
MAVAAAESYPEFETDLSYKQNRDDTSTWLAETLHGSMYTTFNLKFDGQEIYAKDGRSMGRVLTDSVEAAELMVQQMPNLLFEYRRRLIELEEHQVMLGMVRGELPNTTIVVSDYPEELVNQTDDLGGYNSRRQQTMLRVITADKESGTVKIETQSLDRSNRQALEAIYQQMGFTPEPGELLSQTMHLDLNETWQKQLISNLRDVYDSSLKNQFGGDWHAGIKLNPEEVQIDTYEFVNRQEDLIEWFVGNQVAGTTTNIDRIGLAETIRKRYELEIQKTKPVFITRSVLAIQNYNLFNPNVGNLIAEQAVIAISEKRVFSGCGLTIQAGKINQESEFETAGYGNKSDKSSDYKFDKKMYCVVCQAPPSKEEPKKKCGPCGICRTCDRKLGSKG